jgi:PPIC-type PPIASE domain
MREPLLHFVILGCALFAADHLITGRTDDPRVILIDAAVDQQAVKVFKDARGRAPDADELYALRKVWLDNEVLYREGLAMQLDKGDPAIRDRVIFKQLSVIDASTKLPPFDEKLLRDWFEKNRSRYDEPARFDFQEAVLSGDRSESAVRSFVHALNASTTPELDAGLRVFKARPHSNLVQSYGEEFAKALETMPKGEWRALNSREGLRVVRLEAVTPAQAADFDDLKGVVLQDWTDVTMAEQRSAAVRALAKKYVVKVRESGR